MNTHLHLINNCVLVLFSEAYEETQKKENPPFLSQNESSSSASDDDPVPDVPLCQICKDVTTDAVMTPCCGNSYCEFLHKQILLRKFVWPWTYSMWLFGCRYPNVSAGFRWTCLSQLQTVSCVSWWFEYEHVLTPSKTAKLYIMLSSIKSSLQNRFSGSCSHRKWRIQPRGLDSHTPENAWTFIRRVLLLAWASAINPSQPFLNLTGPVPVYPPLRGDRI